MAKNISPVRPPPDDDESETVKVSLNLPRSVMRKVQRLAEKRGVNRTTVIRRAIDLDAFLDDATAGDGKVLVKQGRDLKEVKFG